MSKATEFFAFVTRIDYDRMENRDPLRHSLAAVLTSNSLEGVVAIAEHWVADAKRGQTTYDVGWGRGGSYPQWHIDAGPVGLWLSVKQRQKGLTVYT